MISVCLATYNGEKYIREQLDSIIPQLSLEDEIIISDDGSTDDTLKIIKSYNDKRIKIVTPKRDKKRLDKVQLVTTNFENGLSNAKGEYIFLSDQDDVWHPDRVKIMMDYLKNKGYDYVESDCIVTDSDLIPLSNTRFPHNYHYNKWKSLLGFTPFQGSASAFKREILDLALPFPHGIQSHDRWIGWIASFKFRTLIPLNKPLLYYRRHDSNVSTGISKSDKSLYYRISTRLKYIKELAIRLLF